MQHELQRSDLSLRNIGDGRKRDLDESRRSSFGTRRPLWPCLLNSKSPAPVRQRVGVDAHLRREFLRRQSAVLPPRNALNPYLASIS